MNSSISAIRCGRIRPAYSNSNKWKGKTYVPFMSETLQTWFIYNTKMFKDYGLNKQTPRTYYEKNDWTWARMQELADKFVKKNASKEIVQWGLTMADR